MPIGRSTAKTHQTGATAEDIACLFLQTQDMLLVEKNWHAPKVGEIDLIMRDNQTLVFVEVKLRKHASFGTAEASVSKAKQNKIIRTASCFLAQHTQYQDVDCRFDVVALSGLSMDDLTQVFNHKNHKQLFNVWIEQQKMNWISSAFYESA